MQWVTSKKTVLFVLSSGREKAAVPSPKQRNCRLPAEKLGIRGTPNHKAVGQHLSPQSNSHVQTHHLQAYEEQPDSPDSALLAELLETLMGQL